MNGKRAARLRRYIRGTSVPVDLRVAVYRVVKKWWVSVPAEVRRQAAGRMATGALAVSLRMPVAFQGAKPPKPRRKRNPPLTDARMLAVAAAGLEEARVGS